jgi:hypothetical protein
MLLVLILDQEIDNGIGAASRNTNSMQKTYLNLNS